MRDPYGSVHGAPTERSDSFTTSENAFLGRYRAVGLLRFRDVNAYYCSDCGECYGLYCPNCRIKAPTVHLPTGEIVFRPSYNVDRWNGSIWMRVTCRKCDYEFKVIMR